MQNLRGVTREEVGPSLISNLKLSSQRARLPGIVISFILCPLAPPVYLLRDGARSGQISNCKLKTSEQNDTSYADCGFQSQKDHRASRKGISGYPKINARSTTLKANQWLDRILLSWLTSLDWIIQSTSRKDKNCRKAVIHKKVGRVLKRNERT